MDCRYINIQLGAFLARGAMFETEQVGPSDSFLQGDVVKILNARGTIADPPYGIIINADCDLAHCKIDGTVAYVPVFPFESYFEGFLLLLIPDAKNWSKRLPIRFWGSLIHINSREPSTDLKHAGKRVVFSMPEFVAGLQFEVIYLIHVDAQDAPIELSVGERRRLISNVYLGASRAERELHLSCCETRGGPASYLTLAIERKTLVQ